MMYWFDSLLDYGGGFGRQDLWISLRLFFSVSLPFWLVSRPSLGEGTGGLLYDGCVCTAAVLSRRLESQ